MVFGLPKNIMIKTYAFESGLYYLGLSLARYLKENGHTVYIVPKTKYKMIDNKFRKNYPEQVKEEDIKILSMDDKFPISQQLLFYINKYQIQTIISFETLLECGSWIKNLRNKTGIKVIDVPMLEWVNKSYFENKAYFAFDQVWAVTDHTLDMFKNMQYYNVRRVSWPILNKKDVNKSKDSFIFYHQASINPDYSNKNTNKVVEAFKKLSQEYPDARLHISGLYKNDFHEKISIFNSLSRDGIMKLYEEAHCVVVPSRKEGLGLALYEADANNCFVITTDAKPMNEFKTKYLCEVELFEQDKTLVPVAILNTDSIYKQMKQCYQDNYVQSRN